MSRAPRVTVITATYDYEQVLPFAIESVLAQDYTDFELLVIGDGCRDGSEAVVRSFTDPRVQWHDLGCNTGFQSGPNNCGLEIGRGELVAYLSHDDLWLPHHLRCAVAAIDRGADLAYSTMLRIVPGRRPRFAPFETVEDEWRLAASQIVHRRAAATRVGGWRFPAELRRAPARDLVQRLLRDGAVPAFTRRLSVLKFPARFRASVYRDKPSWEQRAWMERIRSEGNLEIVQLVAETNRDGTSAAAWRRACHIAWREKRASAVPMLMRAGVRNIRYWKWPPPEPQKLRRGEMADPSGRRRPGETYEEAYQRKRRIKGLPTPATNPDGGAPTA